ncbi:MAG TPA: hypothetical protein VK144_02590 [Bacillota bacterium]|nr:hypothetical protein [Bacillota bacterium]
MIVSPILIWVGMLIVFMYTIGFAKELWKDKNKSGAVVVTFIALGVIITPFLSILR